MMNQSFDPTLITLDPEMQDILVDCYDRTDEFCRVFMPHVFYAPFEREIHMKIFDIIDNSDSNLIVITAPRGFGKTSIIRGYLTKQIVYRAAHLICYLAKSEGHAVMQTENLKRELLSNRKLRKLFGSIKVSDFDYIEMEEFFSKKAWTAFGDTLVNPRGALQQIRGMLWREYRPDIIIPDDLEDTHHLDNETLRKSRYDWFTADVMEAVPQLGSDWKIIYIDTVKHEDALIEHLLEDDEWEHLRLSGCDENYRTSAPIFYPQVKLDAELKRHRKNHTMDIFARERMCQPISRETAAFKSEYFKYYSETDGTFLQRREYLENVLLVDPAKTANPKNAQTGVVLWGVDIETNALYQRVAEGNFWHPEEMYNGVFAMAQHYGVRVIGVEVTGLEEFIKYPFQNEALRRGLHFEFVWLKARAGKGEFAGEHGGKTARISALIHLYRQGMIYHNRHNCGPYEQQLITFPRPKKWDIMDAAAYIIEILEMGLRYFNPSFAETEGDAVEREYTDLERLDKLDEIIDYSEYDQAPSPSRIGGNDY